MGLFKSAQEKHHDNLDDEMIYGIVADELARNALSAGLYAKALADVAGDEAKARARYIELRANMLRTERAAVIEQTLQVSQQQKLSQSPAAPSVAVPEIRTRSDIRGRRIIVAVLCILGLLMSVVSIVDGKIGDSFIGLVVAAIFGFAWKMYSVELSEMHDG